jgi:hypothetical protein
MANPHSKPEPPFIRVFRDSKWRFRIVNAKAPQGHWAVYYPEDEQLTGGVPDAKDIIGTRDS